MRQSSSNPGWLARIREFAVRSGVGAVLVAIIAISLWLTNWVLVVLIAAFVLIASHEISAGAGNHGWHPAWVVTGAGGAALMILEYGGWLGNLLVVGMVGCAVLFLVALAWRLRGPVEGYLADVSVTALTIVYLPLLMTFIMAMLKSPHPAAQIATFITVTVIGGDSGAYIIGSLLGRHKLAPHISPAKTWEGIGGAIVFAAILGTVMGLFVLKVPWWQGAVFGVALGAVGAIGDLAESAIKRDVGVKDMGKLLPGHGGAMDRLDSLLFCAPIAWAMMNLWMTTG